MDELISKYTLLMNGIADLNSLMAIDDRGAPYVERLFADSQGFYRELLSFSNTLDQGFLPNVD